MANSLRPHYLFRPAQLVQRVITDLQPQPEERSFQLTWGSQITVNPHDSVGQYLLRRGIFDMLVCEVLSRLTDPGETVIDAGANIGLMTSLFACLVGGSGRVISFEPHPVVFARLSANAIPWAAEPTWGHIELHHAGLSDSSGTATLATDVFDINPGSPSLEPWAEIRGELDQHEVAVQRLDDALGSQAHVGVMKMDVEGHEARALEGASALLRSGRIRDIVFEQHEEPPTPATELLLGHGYSVMRLGERIRGPVAAPLYGSSVTTKDDPSLLATVDPVRAVKRLGRRGWAVYGLGPAGRRQDGDVSRH